MLQTRHATEEDRLDLFKLCIQMHKETDFRHFPINPEKLLNNLGHWIHSGLSLLVVDDGKIVGMLFASIRNSWFSDDNYAAEDILYVLPEYRGTRAAFMLVRGLNHWVKQIGIKHLTAGVSTGTGPGAERLYKHFGMNHMGGNFVAHL